MGTSSHSLCFHMAPQIPRRASSCCGLSQVFPESYGGVSFHSVVKWVVSSFMWVAACCLVVIRSWMRLDDGGCKVDPYGNGGARALRSSRGPWRPGGSYSARRLVPGYFRAHGRGACAPANERRKLTTEITPRSSCRNRRPSTQHAGAKSKAETLYDAEEARLVKIVQDAEEAAKDAAAAASLAASSAS